ncbi:hypothetical protein [Spirosoma oryzicola]|uniref:hypothetical protein n=1 Tax=Spirosoma oryzicola TaxID=2898794 RepID=UPI001E4E344E|nr:hypothetical protein [Spirosoma oryzicola]UHG92523.1 hypothetical protein LQ777_06350 [Spirosoma oryzicola]
MIRNNRPKDVNQLAKLVVDIATGKIPDEQPKMTKSQAAVAFGRLGGKKGGVSRANSLTPEQRKEIAKKAAEKRWSKE